MNIDRRRLVISLLIVLAISLGLFLAVNSFFIHNSGNKAVRLTATQSEKSDPPVYLSLVLQLACGNLPCPPTMTPSPTGSTSMTVTPTLVTSPAPVGAITFPVGPGWADVIPHQIVRVSDDRLYIFVNRGDSSSTLNAFWTTKPGVPAKQQDFLGQMSINAGANILSVDTVYDGANTIHVLTNGQDGKISDRPFDISTNTYKTVKTLASDGGKVSGNYVGTSGLSSAVDTKGVIHLVYWSLSSHIVYLAFTYNVTTDTLSQVDGPTTLDSTGSVNHPALAISPKDGSIMVAWVWQSNKQIQIRSKTGSSWGNVTKVSSANAWTSTSGGLNIDQGPSLIITQDGVARLTYIEDWRVAAPYDYGRVHYVTNNGSGWVDQYTGFYSHDPGLAASSSGQIYIISHGYSLNQTCNTNYDMCLYQLETNGTWKQQPVTNHTGNQYFDSSPSIKWSIVGLNRPDVIEFLFANAPGGNYSTTTLYYGYIH